MPDENKPKETPVTKSAQAEATKSTQQQLGSANKSDSVDPAKNVAESDRTYLNPGNVGTKPGPNKIQTLPNEKAGDQRIPESEDTIITPDKVGYSKHPPTVVVGKGRIEVHGGISEIGQAKEDLGLKEKPKAHVPSTPVESKK